MRARLLLLTAAALLAAPSSLAAQAADDLVRPGDVVRLRIWQEPDLSGEFPVNETGTAVLPKLGPVQAAGVTRQALAARVVAGFGEYLQHNSIDVTVLRRVQVLGAVRSPGLYPVDGTMTVADVLALRDGRRLDIRIHEGSRIADIALRSGDQLRVRQRGWMDRNTGTVVSVLTASAGMAAALLSQ
jgi:protein involved in polysaccharide export with SLBB domain